MSFSSIRIVTNATTDLDADGYRSVADGIITDSQDMEDFEDNLSHKDKKYYHQRRCCFDK